MPFLRPRLQSPYGVFERTSVPVPVAGHFEVEELIVNHHGKTNYQEVHDKNGDHLLLAPAARILALLYLFCEVTKTRSIFLTGHLVVYLLAG